MGLLGWLLGPCDRDAFARKMMAAVRKRGGSADGDLTFDPEHFQLRYGSNGIIGLSNAYKDYCRAGFFGRSRVIAAYASLPGPAELAEDVTWDQARDRLLPRVQNHAYFHSVRMQLETQGAGEKAAESTGCQPLWDGFAVGLVLDHENAIMTVPPSNLTEWGQTPESAMAVAVENLRRRSTEPFQQVMPGLFISPWHDAYEPSRLLLDDLFRGLSVRGRPVVFAPNRLVLIVAGDEDAGALVAAGTLARAAADEDRFVSGIALRLDGSAWVPFRPSPRHPARAAFDDLWYMTFARDYDDQKGLLEKLNERAGVDQFVATCSVVRHNETGRTLSWATWVGVVTDALLPRVDVVAFARGDDPERGTTLFADWDRVVAVAGPLMEPTDHYPPRWRTRSFPSDEQLAAMGAREAMWPAE
ncbi:MAG TPA: hypothetical protein VF796_21135 [Humisphaera sp.]